MPLNFSAPVIDFSPLAKLGETYDRSRKAAAEAEMNQARQAALATFGQGGDPKAMGQKLLAAGDLEGGMSFLRLAESQTSGAASRGIQERQLAETIQARKDALAAQERERGRVEAEREYERNKPTWVQVPLDPNFPKETVPGLYDPRTGKVRTQDGQEIEYRGPAIGPRSSLEDADAPAGGAATAQMQAPGPSSDPGYFIPATGQVLPPGTQTPMPGGGGAADVPAAGAGSAQLAAPPPGATAGAPVAGAPLTNTQISQGTANIPAMTIPELVAEAKRLGISPTEYRAARAAAIQKEMTSKGVDPDKAVGEQAGKIGMAEVYLANAPDIRKEIAAGNQTGPIDKFVANAGWGRGGQVQRQIHDGARALKHLMTGAGVNESEADDYVRSFEPTMTDTSGSLLTKHDQLVANIQRWRTLAYRGKGTMPDLPAPVEKYGAKTLKFDASGNPL